MSANSAIEWTDATWNPVTGCTKVSPGCDHCYAETFAERWRGTAGHYFTNGFDVTLRPDKLNLPLTWRKPKRVFVNSMSDLFHDDVPSSYIAQVFDIMRRTPQHTYQILTKRHARMRSLMRTAIPGEGWPLPNVWLGVSVEDQKWADIRIPALLDTPAAVRFLSCEPLLGPVDLRGWIERIPVVDGGYPSYVDWVVVGGESGHGARPMHPDWARSLRDQCQAAGVPFFYKQNGQYSPVADKPEPGDVWLADGGYAHPWNAGDGYIRRGGSEFVALDGRQSILMRRVRSKHTAGRELDGRTWDEYPQATAVAR